MNNDSLDIKTLIYPNGDIRLINCNDEFYINGIAPDGNYYNENGLRQSTFNIIAEKYYKQFSSDSNEIIFDNRKDFDIFMNWYQINFANV